MAPRPTRRTSRSMRTSSRTSDPLAAADTATFAAIARETKRKIDWDHILRGYNTSAIQWKWLENVRNFSIYTRQGDSADSFGVLAIGSVKGSVAEVVALLQSSRQAEYEQKMAALHGKAFKRGTYIADVTDERVADASSSARLSVRSITFAKSSWLQRDDEWVHLHASQYDEKHQRFEKLFTTLSPEAMTNEFRSKIATNDAKRVANVVGGYCVVPEEAAEPTVQGRRLSSRENSARVYYYADMSPAPSSRGVVSRSKSETPIKTTKQLMLRLARNCERLALVVRRRRLGVQVLVDPRRVLPSVTSKCGRCEKAQLMPKMCRVCGHGMCTDCSDRYERETTVCGARRLELVRVCDPCLARVENADYSLVNEASLAGPAVFPDPVDGNGKSLSSPSDDLKMLLHDALLQPSSSKRKGAVMSVIRCVLDQERAAESPEIDLDTQTLRSQLSDRAYVLDPGGGPGHPVPSNETRRLEVIERLGVLTDGPYEELNIICDLAAKEVGAMASIVTIITNDEQRVIGANDPMFSTAHDIRCQSVCSHTIMDTKPLMIPHPEADVRVSHIAIPSALSVRFYCGFPLKAEDDTVIGSLCCVDQKPHQLTESQFSSMLKLADTASKIIRVRGEKRRTSRAATGSDAETF